MLRILVLFHVYSLIFFDIKIYHGDYFTHSDLLSQ